MLATVATTVFDRLFGARILSIQAFGVSIGYSFFCSGVIALVLRKVYPDSHITITGAFALIAEGLIMSGVPAFISNWKLWKFKAVHIWFLGVIAYEIWDVREFFYFIIELFRLPGAPRRVAYYLSILVVCIVVALCLFPLFVAIMRVTTRTISKSTSPIQIAKLSLLNISPVLMFYGLIMLALNIPDFLGDYGIGIAICIFIVVLLGISLNMAFILSAAFFVLLGTTMFIHRLFWPAISRPLYKLQALGVAKRPKVFAAIGLILVGLGFGKHEWLWFLVSKI